MSLAIPARGSPESQRRIVPLHAGVRDWDLAPRRRTLVDRLDELDRPQPVGPGALWRPAGFDRLNHVGQLHLVVGGDDGPRVGNAAVASRLALLRLLPPRHGPVDDRGALQL